MKFRNWISACVMGLIAVGSFLPSSTVYGEEKAKPKPEKANTAEGKKAEETVTVEIGGLELKLPKSWKQSDATLPMRLATFATPAAEGDEEKGELVLSSFPGGGGGVDANISRWIGQFNPEGRDADVRQGKAGKNDYFIANISGTYLKPDGPPILRKTKEAPGYRMAAVILNVEGKAVYFLKLTGPDGTVAAQIDALRASFGGNIESEKAYEF